MNNVRFSIDIHSEITTEVNSKLGVFDNNQLSYVVAGNVTQDIHQTDSKLHFDNCTFDLGSKYISNQWATIEGIGEKYNQQSLFVFGNLLHTVQDFYAHSNWIELHKEMSPVPLWDFIVKTLPDDIVSGTWLIGFPKKCQNGAPTHDELNKDNLSSKEGQVKVTEGPNSGKTYYQLAYNAALEATVIQFERFKSLPEGYEKEKTTKMDDIQLQYIKQFIMNVSS